MEAIPEIWQRARLWASSLAPWYTALVYRFVPREVPGGETLRFRDGWVLEYGGRLTEAELTALLIEACDHLERDHLARRGDRDPALWSQACALESVGAWKEFLDASAADPGGRRHARFPASTIEPELLGMPANLAAEEYYEHLSGMETAVMELIGPYGPEVASRRPHAPEAGDGVPGEGRTQGPGTGKPSEGTGAHGSEGEQCEPATTRGPTRAQCRLELQDMTVGVDLATSESPAADQELGLARARVGAAIRNAEPGALPAELQLRASLGRRSHVPWRQQLAQLYGAVAGREDFSYLPRPNYGRYLATGALAMRLQKGRPCVTVVRDTSASMDQELLDQTVAEIQGLTTTAAQVLVADADVELHELRPASRRVLEAPVGGGGTDMVAAAWAAYRRTRPECLVVITDGDTPWSAGTSEPPNTIWVVLSRSRVFVPPQFRRVVRVGVAA